MENNKTCHLYTYIFLLVLSFFLFSFNVKADTVNAYLTSNEDPFSALDNLDTIKTNAETLISNNNLPNRYIIFYWSHVNKYYLAIYNSLYDSHREYSYYPNSGLYFTMSQELCYYINSDFTIGSTYTCDYTNMYVYNDRGITPQRFFLLYSSFNFTPNSTLDNVSAITYIYDSYTYTTNTSHLLTLSELSDIWFPSDDTPILTSFYTLVIDKFSTIADFFVDNTYLFAIPLIPIFILCIYLIKRSLIK